MLDFDKFNLACSENDFFNSLNSSAKFFLYSIATHKQYNANEYVFLSSEDGNSEFFIVEKGELRIVLNNGKTKCYKKGDLFGEISVLSSRKRMGTVQAISNTSLIKFTGHLLFSNDRVDPEISLSIIKGLANYVIDYLDEEYLHPTSTLLQKEEGLTIEFKENISESLKNCLLKTICAFLNASGGAIIIGVEDNGNVIGLNDDAKIQSFRDAINSKISNEIGDSFRSKVNFNTELVDGKKLLRINCAPSQVPAIHKKYIKGDKEKKEKVEMNHACNVQENRIEKKEKAGMNRDFYVRTDNQSRKIVDAEEIIAYYKKRWECSLNCVTIEYVGKIDHRIFQKEL